MTALATLMTETLKSARLVTVVARWIPWHYRANDQRLFFRWHYAFRKCNHSSPDKTQRIRQATPCRYIWEQNLCCSEISRFLHVSCAPLSLAVHASTRRIRLHHGRYKIASNDNSFVCSQTFIWITADVMYANPKNVSLKSLLQFNDVSAFDLSCTWRGKSIVVVRRNKWIKSGSVVFNKSSSSLVFYWPD